MHMSSGTVDAGGKDVCGVVSTFANFAVITDGAAGETEYRFAGYTLSGDKPVLLSLSAIAGETSLKYRLHTENAVLGSNLQGVVTKAFAA